MPSQIRATLQFCFPDGHQNTVSLKEGDSIRVGRDLSNDVVLDIPGVSRRHATFDCSSFGVLVSDLASTNGTFLNGEPITSMRDLNNSDVVLVGPVRVLVNLRAGDAPVQRPNRPSARSMTTQLAPVSVTVMLVTIRDYKRMHQSLPADALRSSMDSWMKKLSEVAGRFEGQVDRNMDEMTVLIWKGKDGRQLAQQAARAAQELQSTALQFNDSESWPVRNEIPWQVSTILSSARGLCAIGLTEGGEEEGEIAMINDPVEQAVSMESSIDDLGTLMLLDEATNLLVTPALTPALAGHVPMKGQNGEQPVYTI